MYVARYPSYKVQEATSHTYRTVDTSKPTKREEYNTPAVCGLLTSDVIRN